MDYIGATVFNLVSNPVEQGRYWALWEGFISRMCQALNEEIVNMSGSTRIVCIGKYCGWGNLVNGLYLSDID